MPRVMLVRPHPTWRARVTPTARRYSTEAASGPPKYHSKVRAIPFAFSEEDAIAHVGVTASLALHGRSHKGEVNIPVGSLLTSVLAKYLPMSGFKALRPARIQALYYPTWFVDAELQAKAWFSSSSDSEDSQTEIATAQVNDLYLPGFGMDFGRVLVRDRPGDIHLARRFSSELARQYGFEIICLPYNIAPFDLVQSARNLSYKQATINDDVRFEPRSLKINLAAAYPVLLPAYVAQYVPPEPWPPVTVIIAAHGKPGPHYVHVPSHSDATDNNEDRPTLAIEDYIDEDYMEFGGAPEEADIRAHLISPQTHQDASDELSSWLNDKLHERNAPLSMATRQPVDMDDLKVREWTEEEVEPVRKWLALGESISQMKGMMKAISAVNMDQVKIIEFPPKMGAKADTKTLAAGLEGFFKAEADKLQKLEETRTAETPGWWRQWEESQTPKR
ncbi:hypothetical protein PAXINDRAFT_181099 [Paxillus involutus ATCC 200175]|uniref:Uncharacterized protein n=1 Tax=Paxillus involutus ATCC 200175 TaxID=664439 RepID=A0A0C9SX95_PAXIN|nr:hypothetical protein PAXINDRAFT_181099 [Paxillus involutus ATCC 200175]